MSSDTPEIVATHTDGYDDRGRTADLDDAFDLLADRRRRYVLYYLREEGAADVEELAEQLSRWEGTTTPEHRRRILTELHHKHLPKLTENGVVRVEGSVEVAHMSSQIEAYLDLAAEQERPL
ncbi:DUF7344 domain-containing protein [Halomicrococcus gelatinilyticus]|uniref:DUF7344 domain-containing protein n=1 Tax=Halomicrococcus gelatinilyticus TaxID=1702103 RepID=UPI002E11BE1B